MRQSLIDFFPRSIHCEGAVRVFAPAERVWGLVGNVGDHTIGKAFVERIEVFGEGVGAVRHLHLPNNGDTISERIEEYSTADRYYVYRMIDSGTQNFTNYLAMARVTPAGRDACIVSWNTLAQPVTGHEEEVRAMLQGNINYICAFLAEHFGAAV